MLCSTEIHEEYVILRRFYKSNMTNEEQAVLYILVYVNSNRGASDAESPARYYA